MSQQDNPHLIITLTGRPPVKIAKDDWPVIAEATDEYFDNQYAVQSNQHTRWRIVVRQHSDGRAIVYATCVHARNYQGFSDVRAGEMIPATGDTAAIVAAIQRVGGEIEARLEEEANRGYFPRLVHECIADLPAVEL